MSVDVTWPFLKGIQTDLGQRRIAQAQLEGHLYVNTKEMQGILIWKWRRGIKLLIMVSI